MSDVIEIFDVSTEAVEVITQGPQGPPGSGGGGGGGSGTVTSVALAGTGLSITGSPVTASGTITANVSYGTTAGTACEGNDSRLSNARTPTAHTHVAADITDLQTNGNAAGLWDSVNDEQLVSTGDGELIIRKTTTAFGGALNAGQLTAGRGYDLPNASGTLALTTTVVDNAAGLWDSANSVTGAVVLDYELSVTDGTNTSNLTFPVGASRNYTFPNATGTVALTSDITKTAVGLGNVPNVDTTNAANISSGVLPNARVNWAAPSAIGSTTAAAGTFTTLSANNGTITASAPVLDLSQTWNNAAVTFTGLKFNVTATAAASNSIFSDIQAGGYSQFAIARISSTSNACWIYNTNSGTNTNGVGANYERAKIAWSSNVLQIGTEKLGTGSARALELQTDGTTRITIGATSGNVVCGGSLSVVTNLVFQGNAAIQGNIGAGILRLVDNAGTSFDRLQFGGGTSSFPALKRSSTALQVRLADDSAFAPFECGGLTLNGNLTASTRNIVTDTTTGTRIGTGTTQLLGFWNATPAAQPAAVADATDAASVITQLNALLSRLRTIGVIAT